MKIERVFKSDHDLIRWLEMACNNYQDPFKREEKLKELAEQGIFIGDFQCDYAYLTDLM